tara:strand:+ start:4624 stop:5436 length:813 start_codon:yes stop_codon:yes gene_type:complete
MFYLPQRSFIALVLLGPIACVLPLKSSRAHRPFEFLQVYRVSPSNGVDHEVDLQSVLDQDRCESRLLGPRHFSETVGCLDRPASTPDAYLNWYQIADPGPAPQRRVTVIDLVRGGANSELKIGQAEFLLCPAQRIVSGPPHPIPAGLDHYVAFKVIQPVEMQIGVDVQSAGGTQRRILTRPIYCCVSTRQWHHSQFIDSTHPRDCFVVYQLDAQGIDVKLSTIDQFGLNRLQATESNWLCVLGSLVTPDPSDSVDSASPSDPTVPPDLSR